MILATAALLLALAPSVAITDVAVIDVRRGAVQADLTVIVAGGRIVAFGPSPQTAVPDGAERVDGRGRFLIPGLCDMHVHSGSYENGRRVARLLVANGITCARDMGSPPEDVVRLREDIHAGRAMGPDMVVAGPLLETSLPPSLASNPMLLAAGTAAEARAAVRRLKATGVDFIKVSNSVSRAAYLALADESRRAGLPFAGHVPPAVTAREAARAGQASIEHLGDHQLGVLLSCSRREAHLIAAAQQMVAAAIKEVWAGREPDATAPFRAAFTQPVLATFDQRKAAALVATFKRRGTWHTPTLATLRRSWQSQDANLSAPDRAAGAEVLRKGAELVRMMRDAGVGLLAGTDLPLAGEQSPLADELAALVAAGLTPAEALRTATSGPAQFLGRTDAGIVAVGARADLVLLDSNPLADVLNVRNIVAVILRGRVLHLKEPGPDRVPTARP
jgi:imidazolonepropionase-like amidohydrolase